MKITFLGTAAATSFPLTFCQCKNCKAARKHKGKSIRKRCSLLIDDKILIDLCPDFLTALNMYGKDISKIKYLLQTHPHSDHFDAGHFVTRMTDYATENAPHLDIVASKNCLMKMSEMIKNNEDIDIFDKKWQKDLNISLHELEHGQEIDFEGYKVVAVESLHDVKQGSQLYLIEKGKASVLYATDNVAFSDNALDLLKNKNLSCLILDHTYGFVENHGGHLNEELFLQEIDKLKKINAINAKTLIYATHISHEGCAYHEQMEKDAKGQYLVAYDGLEIKI